VWLAWLLTLPPRPSAWLVALSGAPLLLAVSWARAGASGEPWLVFVRRRLDSHALAGVLLIALGVQFEDTHGITTDGVIYFTQLRSAIFDRDLDVAAEFAILGQPPRPYHVVPIGPTILWLPLYLMVAAVDAVGRVGGLWPPASDPAAVGLTMPYVRAALVSSFVMGAIGLAVLQRHLRAEFGPAVAFAATLLVFGATPLVWYMVYEPSMTHAASFGFVAVFVVAAARWTSIAISRGRAVMLGVLLGLAFITRPQEALFALVPAVLILTTADPLGLRVRAALRLGALAFAGVAPFLALQAVHSAILFSREPFALVGTDGYIDFLRSRWADTLWSSWHGFLSWAPVAYIALLGTAAYATRRWRWALAAIVIVFLMAWVNGSTADWAAGWSFGGRRFTSCLVVLAPGLAFVVHQLVRQPIVAIAGLALAAVVWNQLLVAQYTRDMLPAGESVSFGRVVRQQAELATRPPFFYPFALPANAWFAWRTGLPIDAYDLLGPEPLRASIDLALDEAAGPFLVSGWGPRGSDPWGDLRWLEGGRAELVLPLDPSSGGSLQMEIHARSRLLDPPVRGVIALAVNGTPIGTLAPRAEGPSTVTFLVDRARFTRGWNRVTFEHVGAEHGDDIGDSGPVAAGPVPVAVYRVVIR
jgi:hypothetical protein